MVKKVSEVSECDNCPLANKYPNNTFVAPKISNGGRLVVAEAPGKDEALAGEPLVGPSGRTFDGLLSKAGISRDSLTILNTIQCRPPDNVFPTSPEAKSYISKQDAERALAHCYEQHIKPVVRSRQWDRIDCLGGEALTAITGKRGIFANRGFPLASKEYPEKQNVVATIHPAALMRDQTMYPVVVSDLKKSLIQPPERYNVYPSLEDARNFTATEFAYDIENQRYTGEVFMVGFSAKPFEAICIPFKGSYVSEIKRIFANAKKVIGHNIIAHDEPHLERAGIPMPADLERFDTILLHHLISPQFSGKAGDEEGKGAGKDTVGGHSLEFIASIYCNKPKWKHQIEENKELYCCRDTDVTLQIFQQLLPLLRQFQLEDIYKYVSLPMAQICRQMKETGFKLDNSRLGEVRERLLKQTALLEAKLPPELQTHQVPVNRRILAPPGARSEKTGKPIKYLLHPSSETQTPWRSDKSVGVWLYTTLGLPVQKHIKTGQQTTDKTAMARLVRLAKEEDKPAIRAIKELRSVDEILTTFAKEKMQFGSEIHANFNVHGTCEGRLSSSEPNMQNIPEETRCIYIPHQQGWKIVSVDYSQIENRLTAHLAGDTERLQRFLRDPDFSEHKYAASIFFGIPYDEVQKDNDREAPYGKSKRIVHGSNYGMGPRKIANLYDMIEKECKQLQKQWKEAIGATSKWQEATAALAKEQGYLVNPFGRRRWFYTSNYYTQSLSYMPQSTAADIILRAMVALCYERINYPLEKVLKVAQVVRPLPRPARLLASVHDSLVVECPAEQVDEVVEVMTAVMTQPWPQLSGFSNPISIEVGDDWGPKEKGGSLEKYVRS